MVLMRTNPFRELDRWTQQVLGTRPVLRSCPWTPGETASSSSSNSICPGSRLIHWVSMSNATC